MKELFKRYVFFIIGLFASAIGVSLITKAQLGTSPISSVPYILSIGFPLTMGTFTFLVNTLLTFGQIAVQKRSFQKLQLIQIPISIIFGYFIDFTMTVFSFLNPTSYVLKVLILLIGCGTLGLGICIQMIANVVMLSGEAFVKVISAKLNKQFGNIKVLFDITFVVTSCIISLVIFHKFEGVREGTIISALIVGQFAKVFYKKLRFISNELLMEKQLLKEEEKVPLRKAS